MAGGRGKEAGGVLSTFLGLKGFFLIVNGKGISQVE